MDEATTGPGLMEARGRAREGERDRERPAMPKLQRVSAPLPSGSRRRRVHRTYRHQAGRQKKERAAVCGGGEVGGCPARRPARLFLGN